MPGERLEVAGIFRAHGAAWRQANAGHLSRGQLKVMAATRALPHRRARGLRPPFGGPKAVLAYLSRTTHRVAISNSRLISLDDKGVTFK